LSIPVSTAEDREDDRPQRVGTLLARAVFTLIIESMLRVRDAKKFCNTIGTSRVQIQAPNL
jgi:hypothetical protein